MIVSSFLSRICGLDKGVSHAVKCKAFFCSLLACLLCLVLCSNLIVRASLRNLGFVEIHRLILAQDNKCIATDKTNLVLTFRDQNIRRILAQLYIQYRQFSAAKEVLLGDSQTCTGILECFYLGEAFWGSGQHEKAFHVWRDIKNIDVYFALKGDIIYARGEKSIARQYYVLSWEISPSPKKQKRNMLLNLCRDARSNSERQIAIEWCRNAVAATRDYWTLVELGRTLFEAADYHSAEEILREALVLPASQKGEAYYYLGLALRRLGKEREGAEALAMSVKLMPSSVWAQIAIADVLASSGCYQQAIAAYTRALDLTQQDSLRAAIQTKIQETKKQGTAKPALDSSCSISIE